MASGTTVSGRELPLWVYFLCFWCAVLGIGMPIFLVFAMGLLL